MNEDNAKQVIKYLHKLGLSDKEILAMAANAAVESAYTFDPTITQKGDRTDPAKGLFQYDPRGSGLGALYPEYLKETGKEDSMQAQLDFMVESLKGQYRRGRDYMGYGNVRNFNKAAADPDISTEDLTRMFSENILRPGKPHMDRRLQAIELVKPLLEGTPKQGILGLI